MLGFLGDFNTLSLFDNNKLEVKNDSQGDSLCSLVTRSDLYYLVFCFISGSVSWSAIRSVTFIYLCPLFNLC